MSESKRIKLINCTRKSFNQLTDDDKKHLNIYEDVYRYVTVDEQTLPLCMSAVLYDGAQLEFVVEQTEPMCLAAVDSYSAALQYVRHQTPIICSVAVRKSGTAIEHVARHLLTEELCLSAIDNYKYAINHIPQRFRTEKLINAANR